MTRLSATLLILTTLQALYISSWCGVAQHTLCSITCSLADELKGPCFSMYIGYQEKRSGHKRDMLGRYSAKCISRSCSGHIVVHSGKLFCYFDMLITPKNLFVIYVILHGNTSQMQQLHNIPCKMVSMLHTDMTSLGLHCVCPFMT
jgi:hypothetical protein